MATNDIITSDLIQSESSALVELFELILDPSDNNPTLFFHPGVEENLSTLKFHPHGEVNKNNTSDGPGNRPTLTQLQM